MQACVAGSDAPWLVALAVLCLVMGQACSSGRGLLAGCQAPEQSLVAHCASGALLASLVWLVAHAVASVDSTGHV